MNWKQKSEATWWALSPQCFPGKFIIAQQADGGFTVEHLSTRWYCGHGTRPKRNKLIIGRAPSLPEAQAAAAAFIRDELWYSSQNPVETVDA